MIKKKHLFIGLLLLAAIVCLSSVNASDVNATSGDDNMMSIDEASSNNNEITQETQMESNNKESDEALSHIDDSDVLTDNSSDSKIPIEIISPDKTIEYNSEDSINIKVVDKQNGTAVSGAYILFTIFKDSINSDNYLLQTSDDGKITFSVSLDVGTHKVIAQSADKRYSSDNVTSYITVTKANAIFKVPAVTMWYKSGKQLTINVYNSKNNQLMYDTKVDIRLYVSSTKYYSFSGRTGANGKLSVDLGLLKVGVHKVVVVPADSKNYDAQIVKSSVTIKTKLTYKIRKVSALGTKGFMIYAKDKIKKKLVNGIKFKLKIYTGKKYKVKYLVSGYDKETKKNGEFGYGTNMLSVGTHKVVVTPVTKGYTGKVTSKIVVTKKAKKNYYNWVAYDTKGKSYLKTGGKKLVM